ncbi:two-component system response regulator [Mucilaginibacter sp. PAMC 26640]|nr:two-component system response regulator [Mucilaginibacter sp. PAMC 26640]
MKKKILVVDDDLSILKLLNFILSKEFDIVVKNNGIDAFKWLEDGNIPKLIISDLQMPYFDGQSFVKNLKISGFYREIPVILLSAAHDLKEQVANMPFKVEAYIHKPFSPTSLKLEINQALKAYDAFDTK